jgi:hypothetical protein
MKRAVMSETVNRHPYSFAVRAWSEHFYFLRDEVTVSNFQCVLIAGMEIMEQCVAPKVARLNATPLRGKNAPLKRDVLLAPVHCLTQPGASSALLEQGNMDATHHFCATKRYH